MVAVSMDNLNRMDWKRGILKLVTQSLLRDVTMIYVTKLRKLCHVRNRSTHRERMRACSKFTKIYLQPCTVSYRIVFLFNISSCMFKRDQQAARAMELISLILISVLSFASAQVDCPAFNVSDLGATDMLTQGGLVGSALAAVSGDPSLPVSVQVHDSNIVCLRSGRTRDTYSGVSVVVNYTCSGAPSECTGNPILSQFDLECVANPVRWAASVDGSADNIITTPPSGSLSTTQRTDCGVCISPARSIFAAITDNEQHCGCEYIAKT